MAYSTIDDVRSESWFVNNANILDSMITTYLNRWDSEVKSYVSAVYDITTLTGTNFTGSQAETFLKGATDLISSGYLLIKQYGNEWLDTTTDGRDKLNEGRGMLMQLYSEPPIRLIGVDGTEFTRIGKSTAGVPTAGGAVSGSNTFAVDDEY